MIRCQAGKDFVRQASMPTRSLAPTGTARPAGRQLPPASTRAAPSGTWVVVYAAAPPNASTGISRGQRDRLLAYHEAERACFGKARTVCNELGEAGPGECIAVAQEVEQLALFRTADPRTFRIRQVRHGKGTDEAEAGRMALAACHVGRGKCEIVASACGAR